MTDEFTVDPDEVTTEFHFDTSGIRTDLRQNNDERKGVIAVGNCETEERQARFAYTWHGPEAAHPVLIDTDEMWLSCKIEFWRHKETCVGHDREEETVDQHADAEQWAIDHFDALDPVTVLTERYDEHVPKVRR
jgi:hypothetical protein